jgi:hypothetical protein
MALMMWCFERLFMHAVQHYIWSKGTKTRRGAERCRSSGTGAEEGDTVASTSRHGRGVKDGGCVAAIESSV